MPDNSDHQDASRRHFLKGTLTLIPAVAVLGSSLASTALAATDDPRPAPTDSPPGDIVTTAPVFFTIDEWRFLLAACNRLIPTDDNGPGAVAEGVPDFIDRQMETPYGHGGLWYMKAPFFAGAPGLGWQNRLTPRDIYRIGIAELDRHCQERFANARFHQLEPALQDTLLKQLEQDQLDLGECPGKLFFQQLWQNTREGWMSDPIHGGNRSMASWKLIGFPGARADFTDWVGRTNAPYPQGPVGIAGKRGEA